jgi:hypothetical protein
MCQRLASHDEARHLLEPAAELCELGVADYDPARSAAFVLIRIPSPVCREVAALAGTFADGRGWFRTSDLSRVKR